MKALVQRVKQASVRVGGETVAQIGPGLLVFLGVGTQDGKEDGDWLAGKIARMRIFPDAAGKMNLSLDKVGGDVIVVSQFTLYGDMQRGNRPSFTAAAAPELADRLYQEFCQTLREHGLQVKTGTFAAHMDVDLTNDGPVTLWLQSPNEKETGK